MIKGAENTVLSSSMQSGVFLTEGNNVLTLYQTIPTFNNPK